MKQADKAGSKERSDAKNGPGGQREPKNENNKNDAVKRDQRAGEKSKGGTDQQQGDKADVEELIKELKNGNASVRREAAKKLSDTKDRIDDPRLREAAEEALRRSDKAGDDHAAGQKGREQGKGENGKRADQRGESNEQSADRGNAGKKSDADQKPGSANHRGDGKGQGEQARQRDGRSPPPGNDGRRQESTAVNSDEPAEPGQAANRKYQKRAGELQLDDLKKKVNKDVLKKANMTEEEYQQFLKAYQEMQKRKESDAGNEEKLTDPKAASPGLRSLKSRSAGTSKGKPDDLQHGGASLPPPEYREAYQEFTRKLSDLERTRETQKSGDR